MLGLLNANTLFFMYVSLLSCLHWSKKLGPKAELSPKYEKRIGKYSTWFLSHQTLEYV